MSLHPVKSYEIDITYSILNGEKIEFLWLQLTERNLKNANDYLAWILGQDFLELIKMLEPASVIIHSFYKEQLLLSTWIIKQIICWHWKDKNNGLHRTSFTSAALGTVGFILEENLMHSCCL